MARNLYVYDTNLSRTSLSPGKPNFELEYCDEAFEYLAAYINAQNQASIIRPEDKGLLLQGAEYAKNVNKGMVFEGLFPSKGYGVRYPLVEDVTGNAATDTSFDINWANAGNRIWISSVAAGAAFNAATFAAGLTMGFQDLVTDEPWPSVLLGVMSGAVNVAPRLLHQELNRNPFPTQNLEPMMRTTEMVTSRIAPVYIPHDKPYKAGFNIVDATLAAQYTAPLMFTYVTSTRAKNIVPGRGKAL